MQVELIEKWMKEALNLAEQAAKQDEIPIGCVIVHNNQLIGSGMNLRETTHKTTAHAEIVALENYNIAHGTWRLPENTWVIVTAEPCLMCAGALLWGRAARVVFGCYDPRKAGLGRLNQWIEEGIFDHRFQEVRGGILEADCAQILKDYFKSKRS